MKKRKELKKKILETNHRRNVAIAGLLIGIALAVLGQLVPFPALSIIGFTIFIICAGATSFFTVLKWQYSKAMKADLVEKTKPPTINVCPRCGTRVKNNKEYCSKCGKKIQTKKN